MKKETRTIIYDEELQIETYRFEGIVQPFPNHFHEHYVIGFVENGQRILSCKNRDYNIGHGNIVLFHPGDNHACMQSDGGAFDYRGFNISKSCILDLTKEVTGKRELPGFSKNVIYDDEITCYLRPLHEMVMRGISDLWKEENLLFLISALIQKYGQPFESCIPECPHEIEKACEFMQQHFKERIYLDEICRYADLSKSTLLRAFTKAKSITPYRYLETLRINEAKLLLKKGVPPIDVAMQTGFSDQSHFTNCFSSFTGLSPCVYRDIFSEKNRKDAPHEKQKDTRTFSSNTHNRNLGNYLYLHKNPVSRFQACRNIILPLCHGLLILLVSCPKQCKTANYKEELTYALAGLSGICLYYLLENISLTYTLASNVSVIISVAPFFTAILAHLFVKSEMKLQIQFFAGFLVAMTGIILISFNGQKLKLNPIGNLLALIAAFVWAFYSILTKKISSFGYPVILSTRRTFFYGIIFMTPVLFFSDFQPGLSRFMNMTYLFNILYLGLGASALCFVTWNFAVKELGAVKTSVYIYMVPIITVITSVLILQEELTILAGLGTLLILMGLFLSEYKPERKDNKNGFTK